jgi:hypothetical protein
MTSYFWRHLLCSSLPKFFFRPKSWGIPLPPVSWNEKVTRETLPKSLMSKNLSAKYRIKDLAFAAIVRKRRTRRISFADED